MDNNEKVCFYCRRKATRETVLPKHHPLGRANSDIIVDTCENCHHPQTQEQNKLTKELRSKDAPPHIRRSYANLSWGLHLQQLGQEVVRLANEELEEYHDNSIHTTTPRKRGQERKK
jgi:hypothetical protein